jgi:hypothetical protein
MMRRTLMINPTFVNPATVDKLMDRYKLRAPYCGIRDILKQVQEYSWPVKIKLSKPEVHKGNYYGILVNIEAPEHLADYNTLGTVRNHLADILPGSIRDLLPRNLRNIINQPDNIIVEVARTDEGIKIIGSTLEDMEGK